MNKPALLCLCLGLLVGCQAPAEPLGPPPPQVMKPDAAKKAFFGRIRYPYYASKARRRRIEWAYREMRLDQTPAQMLAELGPPDWKAEGDGYPPKIPPYEVWYYVHTLERPLGPHYEGKLLLITVDKTTPPALDSIEERGLQKIGK